MATAPVGCELIDLTMSSPESSDVDSDAGSESDESVIVTEIIRYVRRQQLVGLLNITFSRTFFLRVQTRPENEVREPLV